MSRGSEKQSEAPPNNAAQGYVSAALSGDGSFPVNVPFLLSMSGMVPLYGPGCAWPN